MGLYPPVQILNDPVYSQTQYNSCLSDVFKLKQGYNYKLFWIEMKAATGKDIAEHLIRPAKLLPAHLVLLSYAQLLLMIVRLQRNRMKIYDLQMRRHAGERLVVGLMEVLIVRIELIILHRFIRSKCLCMKYQTSRGIAGVPEYGPIRPTYFGVTDSDDWGTKMTDQCTREVQEPVGGEEVLNADDTSTVLCNVPNRLNNKYGLESVENTVRLLNDHLIHQLLDDWVSDNNYSIPALPGTNFLVYQIWAIWFIVRRWVSDSDITRVLVADEMGPGMMFNLTATVMIFQLLIGKILVVFLQSILWGNTFDEWVNMTKNNYPANISDEWWWCLLQRLNSVFHCLLEIQTNPTLAHPARTWALDPIMVVTMPQVIQIFNNVIDEMTHWDKFQTCELIGHRKCESHPWGFEQKHWQTRKWMESPACFIWYLNIQCETIKQRAILTLIMQYWDYNELYRYTM